MGKTRNQNILFDCYTNCKNKRSKCLFDPSLGLIHTPALEPNNRSRSWVMWTCLSRAQIGPKFDLFFKIIIQYNFHVPHVSFSLRKFKKILKGHVICRLKLSSKCSICPKKQFFRTSSNMFLIHLFSLFYV